MLLQWCGLNRKIIVAGIMPLPRVYIHRVVCSYEAASKSSSYKAYCIADIDGSCCLALGSPAIRPSAVNS